MARSAVARKAASFPLSTGHFFETRHRKRYESRRDLGATMVELSEWHAIAPPHVVVPVEVDRALYRHADPDGPRPPILRTFGSDAKHALGIDVITDDLPDHLEVPVELRSALRKEVKELMQWMVLVGGPTDHPLSLDDVRVEQNSDQRFADGQKKLAEHLLDHGLNRSSRLGDAMTAIELADIVMPLVLTADARGLDIDALFDLGREWLTSLLRDMPSRWITREMRRTRHANSQQGWSRTDLNDAVAYCDVVATEKQWVHHLRQAGLDRRFDTTLISDLRELPTVLAGPA